MSAEVDDDGRALARLDVQPLAHVLQLELRDVPLREHEDGRRVRAARHVGHVQILLGDALGGVDQDERDVGAASGLERAHLAPELHLLALRAVAPQAGRVDQAVDAVAALEADVDRVARRARDLGDDRALLVAERVQERRLADVRAAEDGDADLVRRALDVRRVQGAQARDDLVEQVARGDAVQRREGERLTDAQLVVLEREIVAARVVELVRDQQHRHVRAAQAVRQLQVGRAGRGRGVDEQQHEVGLADRELGLADDLALERAVVARIHPAGVDQCEERAAPLHDHALAVARHAGLGMHHRLARRRQAVDERRLAGIRLAHDRDRAQQRALGLRLGLGGALPRAAGARGFVAHASPRASRPARSRGRPAAMAACVRRWRRSSSRCSSAVVVVTASR